MVRQYGKSRSGVALIIVLGLIAILMIVCVSFTINMRVERAGAANLRHGAVASQIVKGAMAAAIATIDKELSGDVVPQWYNTNAIGSVYYERKYTAEGSSHAYNLWKDTLVSFDPNAYEHIDASFFTPSVEAYFPSGSAYKGYATECLSKNSSSPVSIKKPEWIPVYGEMDSESEDDDAVGGNDVIGRYAFVALNTSGLLDASCILRSANRWMGHDPGEIQLPFGGGGGGGQKLTDDASKKNGAATLFLDEILDVEGLRDNMLSDGRYDSFAEFLALNERNKNASDNVITNCRSFNTFSYEPASVNDLIDISSLSEIKKHKKEIIEAFYDCGLTGGKEFGHKDCEQARWAYLGLVDYVDEDSDMEDDDKVRPWQRPATENMPLMSGFIAKITLERRELPVEAGQDEAGNKYYKVDPAKCEFRISGDFKVPFINPFISSKCDKFKLTGKAQFMLAPGNEKQIKALATNISKKNPVETSVDAEGVDDNSVKGLKIEGDWVPIANVDGNPHPLKGLELYIQAAGSTELKSGGKVQRRYPLQESRFKGDDESWLTVPFSTEYSSIEFDNDNPNDTRDAQVDGHAVKSSTGASLKIRTWETNVIVWAEFVDPRFASLDMENDAEWDSQMFFYRASHGNEDSVKSKYAHTTPVTVLKSKSGFSDFTAADKVTAADFDKDDDYGGYFDGSKARNGTACKGGASPLASYMLTHPKVATEVYEMNVDGVRVSNNETQDTTDNAKMKWRAYVKNGPLESVGELGYLPIGPWYTIRLYDYNNVGHVKFSTGNKVMTKFSHLPSDDDEEMPPFHPVLDYFTVTKVSPQGRVNINSLNESVIASVFYDMPINSEVNVSGSFIHKPDTSGKDHKYRITVDGARNLAEALIQCREDGEFENLADLGYMFRYGDDVMLNGDDVSLPVLAVDDAARSEAFGEFEREAVIRNSCGLFTMRGQTFVIAVRGESYSPMYGKTSLEGGSVNAAKTAIAQIWRDTEPDEDGNHPIFVQFFKILDE